MVTPDVHITKDSVYSCYLELDTHKILIVKHKTMNNEGGLLGTFLTVKTMLSVQTFEVVLYL